MQSPCGVISARHEAVYTSAELASPQKRNVPAGARREVINAGTPCFIIFPAPGTGGREDPPKSKKKLEASIFPVQCCRRAPADELMAAPSPNEMRLPNQSMLGGDRSLTPILHLQLHADDGDRRRVRGERKLYYYCVLYKFLL
jgi:hypothetical protein